jgi:hypothetical protein
VADGTVEVAADGGLFELAFCFGHGQVVQSAHSIII